MSSSLPPGTRPQPLAGERPAGGAVSSDELLPPVEPPSAGFILQLFVVPAVIVAGVVLFWFVIESLARRDQQNADEIVAALRSSNQARFQRASDLADMLRLPERYPELKANRELAQKLAALLNEQIDAADDGEAAVTMRIFLCTALGEFNVDDGLPILLKAARSDHERDVRRRAINSIAVLADSLRQKKPPQELASADLVDALAAFEHDSDELMRSETAFALGVVAANSDADPRLAAELEELADDPYTDARFNATTGLARLGRPRAVAGIAEMLDPESIASSLSGEKAVTDTVSDQKLRAQKAYKRDTIINSALSAINMLMKHGPIEPDPSSRLQAALTKFLAAAPAIKDPAPVPVELINAATRALEKLRTAGAAAPAK